MVNETEASNFDIFRDCFSSSILQRLKRDSPKSSERSDRIRNGRKRASLGKSRQGFDEAVNDTDGEELADFIDYLASETFSIFPHELKQLSYAAIQNDTKLESKYTDLTALDSILSGIPPSVTDSLEAYALLPSSTDLSNLILSTVSDYVTTVTSPPPIWANTRASACEICDRDWIPLTYHHLIPKQVHDKALKRHWHEEWELNSVAWLCRACHSFVHKLASNEVLAKELYTVDLLMERNEVKDWAKWVGRVRWKAR